MLTRFKSSRPEYFASSNPAAGCGSDWRRDLNFHGKRPVGGRVAELSGLRRGMDVSRRALGQQRTAQAARRGCLYRTSFFVFLSTTRRCQKGRRNGTTPPS